MTADIPILSTRRLLLRPLAWSDADALQASFPRWEIVRFLTDAVPWPYPPDGAATYLRDVVLPAMQAGRAWHWSIRLLEAPDRLIGAIGLTDSPDDNRGFWLDPDWHGQGLMSEASAAVTAHWFEALGRSVLRVPKAIANTASRRISERSGMRVVATGEKAFLSGRHPFELWEITAAEWRERPARPRVVILNGAGSVGKSSTARALQAITARPFLHVEMDAFIAMLPERLFGHPDGMVFETIHEDGQAAGPPTVVIRTGPEMGKAMRGMRRAVAAMAAAGNELIVDDVMLGVGEAADYLALLGDAELCLVGLSAPLDVLEARELARGDRQPGLARWQVDRVHEGVTYQLELDTGGLTPLQCAERIKARFGL